MAVKAVSIDLDGTIVPGTTTGQYLARCLGHGDAMNALEEAYARGEISNRVVADRDGGFYAGKATAEIRTLLRGAPVIGGLRAAIAALHEAGIAVILGTVTWKFIAEYYRDEYGFAAASGVEMGESPAGVLTGSVTRYFDEFDKVAFAQSFCDARRIAMADCAAVGDSRSDIPLFGAAGLSIAFNGTDAAKAAAHRSIDGSDLSAILPLILR